MSPPVKIVSTAQARRFIRRALRLDDRFGSVAAALDHLGYVQIDPLNICGRMQDLILRNRVAGYREGDLMRHLHGPEAGPRPPAEARVAFEHHLPSTAILAAFGLEAWPHLLAAMEQRTKRSSAWSGRLTPRERDLAKLIFEEIEGRGPLSSDDVKDERRGRRVWGSATLAKSTMQKLFFHGRLLIARRDKNRRVYDLPERVLPARVLAAPRPQSEETTRWLALVKLRQRRLAWLKREEWRAVADRVCAVRLADQPEAPVLHCLREDERWFEEAVGEAPSDEARLLAPLDPLIYDRRVTRVLWNFDYVWEAYVPPAKRVRGHYALPVLSGLELVGHVEPKADRVAGRLELASRRVRRGHAVACPLKALAAFLGLRR